MVEEKNNNSEDKKIKVLHLSTSVSSSSACGRLSNAINNCGNYSDVFTLNNNSIIYNMPSCNCKNNLQYFFQKQFEKLLCALLIKREYKNMPYSFGIAGKGIKYEKLIENYDIVHIHWICDFISLNELDKIIKCNKPVVITAHDNWFITGGCHVRLGCEKFSYKCEKCKYLRKSIFDICKHQFKQKTRIFRNASICIISPSIWMNQNIESSLLLKNQKHVVIGNSINTRIFSSKQNSESPYKNEIILLFGAVNAIETKYKGYSYFVDALKILKERIHKRNKDFVIKIGIFGSEKSLDKIEGFKCINYGYVNDENALAKIYSSADMLVVPSLEDSFNQTVAESMSCETPVVAFATGGIKDIIDHKKNGFLAEYANATDLAYGIEWIIINNVSNEIGKNSREKIVKCFSNEKIAAKHLEVYRECIN